MLDDYKLKGTTQKLEVEVEEKVAVALAQMESFIKLSQSEIVNTALKRFIAGHKDFLPQPQTVK